MKSRPATNRTMMVCAISAAFVAASCATTYSPIRSPGVELRTERRYVFPVVVSGGLSATATPEIRDSDILFHVTIANDSSVSVMFVDTDFAVSTSDSMDGGWVDVPVIESRKYLAEQSAISKATIIGNTLFFGLAAMRGTTSEVSMSGTGPSGSYRATGTIHSSSPDPSAVYAGRSINQGVRNSLATLENSLFFEKEIAPGETYYGIVASRTAWSLLLTNSAGRYIRLSIPSIDAPMEIIWSK